MVLDQPSKAKLEQIIDYVITRIPFDMKVYRTKYITSGLQLKEEADFVLGITWGRIMTSFGDYFLQFGRVATQEEIQEISEILLKRTKELRDDILKAG